jgi:hypothetical protein
VAARDGGEQRSRGGNDGSDGVRAEEEGHLSTSLTTNPPPPAKEGGSGLARQKDEHKYVNQQIQRFPPNPYLNANSNSKTWLLGRRRNIKVKVAFPAAWISEEKKTQSR